MSRPRLGFVALGLAALAEERIAGVVRFVEDTTRSVGAPIAELTAPLVPEPLRRLIEAAVADLDERGRTVAEAGAVRGNELAELVADRVSQDPAMQKVVDNVIDNVLPDVLERLAKEPEQIRVIVQGQSLGMVEEMTRAARERATNGDDAVDRFVSNLLRRDSGRHRRIRRRSQPDVIVQPEVVLQPEVIVERVVPVEP
jgi:hypothetical protein